MIRRLNYIEGLLNHPCPNNILNIITVKIVLNSKKKDSFASKTHF